MPRIIPRLLKALQESSLRNKPQSIPLVPAITKHRNKKKSLWKPVLDASTSLAYRGRTQSVLLDDTNPVEHREAFERHKRQPPKVFIEHSSRKTRKRAQKEEDAPRSMTDEERTWWASPYLRMLSGPMRPCVATGETLPRDFLVRLAPMQLPVARGARSAQVLLPDGVEHPLYRHRRNGLGVYILCAKMAVDQMRIRNAYRRAAPNATIHSQLAAQIGHLLRVRVLQELELLASRLPCRPLGAHEHPLIRRLTRAEWRTVRETGTIPYENAAALIIVPPLNKDPTTKLRPVPSTSVTPPAEEERAVDGAAKIPKRSSLPVSELLPTAEEAEGLEEEYDMLPKPRVPLYNGVALFPWRTQRAALHQKLNNLLFVERRARMRKYGDSERSTEAPPAESKEAALPKRNWAKGDEKASHAYLLFSDKDTLLRAETVPLAIALWRVRMWEGGGSDTPLAQRWKLKPLPLPT